jgi:hypothetical protein
MLADEFTSLEEPTDVSEVVVAVFFPIDGPELIRSERCTKPRDPT